MFPRKKKVFLIQSSCFLYLEGNLELTHTLVRIVFNDFPEWCLNPEQNLFSKSLSNKFLSQLLDRNFVLKITYNFVNK